MRIENNILGSGNHMMNSQYEEGKKITTKKCITEIFKKNTLK